MATNIYRRGTMLWWRRSVYLAALSNDPIIVRLSLKTRCPCEGKTRAAHLETEIRRVGIEVAQALKRVMTPDDMRAVYKAAFTAKLDEYIIRQAATPYRADAHAVTNLIYARFFSLLAAGPHAPDVDGKLIETFKAMGLSDRDAENLFVTIAQHRGNSPISVARMSQYLQEQGISATNNNLQSMAAVTAAAYRNACISATEAMGMKSPEVDVWPLPTALRHLLHLDQTEAEASRPLTPEMPSTNGLHPSPQSDRHFALQQPQSAPCTNGRQDAVFSAVVEQAIRKKIDNGDWDAGRKRDLNAVKRLFIAANGDLLLSQINQKNCKAMTDLFPKLPSRYGHTKEDIEGGIEAALERGTRLKILWDEDPIKAETECLPTLGLSKVTHNKHLTWLSAIFSFAEEEGLVSPKIDFKNLRESTKKGKKKSRKRRAWSKIDLQTLLSGTIWTGCSGLWQRFNDGNEIYHDGTYFAPLLIGTSGTRSEETTGLMLADIFENAPIPHYYLRENPYRRLKNEQSERRIPISPKLIDLGFLEYVGQMRSLGHALLFPEFFNPKESMSFDHIFYDKVFQPLRDFHFPDGTSRKSGRKDVDVHSIRTFTATFLRDRKFEPGLRQYLLGHVPDGETAASYEEEPDLSLVLPLVAALDEVINHLERKPINLRPPEWQKFGAPRGRRRHGTAS